MVTIPSPLRSTEPAGVETRQAPHIGREGLGVLQGLSAAPQQQLHVLEALQERPAAAAARSSAAGGWQHWDPRSRWRRACGSSPPPTCGEDPRLGVSCGGPRRRGRGWASRCSSRGSRGSRTSPAARRRRVAARDITPIPRQYRESRGLMELSNF